VWSLAYSRDGNLVAAGGKDRVHVWEVPATVPRGPIPKVEPPG
jgi:hypothetical protein